MMTRALVMLTLVLGLATGLTASSTTPLRLSQDLYVWQRRWTPSLDQAMAAAGPGVHRWRVLAAETGLNGQLQAIPADLAALRRQTPAVRAVFRINDGAPEADLAARRQDIVRIANAWSDAGVRLDGVEVDYDCPTRILPAYAAFLMRLRRDLPVNLRLSITALPAWLPARALPKVLSAADEAVLQVHAVEDPRLGLFNARRARLWIDAFSLISDKPFSVALPAYGARVVWDDAGRRIAVEGERPRLAGGARSVELMADPHDVAALLRDVRQHPPAHLTQIVWFRLPLPEDQRAWSLATLQAVMTGGDLSAPLDVVSAPSDVPGVRNLYLANRSALDASAPRRIDLPRACQAADGFAGYRADTDAAAPRLIAASASFLPAHSQILIGWARCSISPGEIHVAP